VTLAEVRAELGDCARCPLHQTRQNLVFGVGPHDARIMVVGEAPGADEDAAGEPFVGQAGKIFNRLLHHAGLSREDLYITNILKCRPPGNADPEPIQMTACVPFLHKQVAALAPKVIVTLGKFAGCRMSLVFTTMGELVKLEDPRYQHGDLDIPVIPLYHPSYLQRQGRSSHGKEIAKDSVERLRRAAALAA